MALHARGTILHLASVMHGLQSSISAFTKAARCKYKGDLKEAKSGLDNNVFVVHLTEGLLTFGSQPSHVCGSLLQRNRRTTLNLVFTLTWRPRRRCDKCLTCPCVPLSKQQIAAVHCASER